MRCAAAFLCGGMVTEFDFEPARKERPRAFVRECGCFYDKTVLF